jgi:DNA-binding beta-propeller fold protein YncE
VRLVLVAALSCAGCSAGDESGESSSGDPCSPFEASSIEVGGTPGSLHYDPDLQRLHVVDDATNRVFVYGQDEQLVPVGGVPSATDGPSSDSLSELAVAADGAVHVARYGFGDAAIGAVFRIRQGADPERITGLAASVRRIGLVLAAEPGVIFVSAHEPAAGGGFVGHVDRADLAGGSESHLVDGLSKPTGLVDFQGGLLVAEPAAGTVYRIDLAAPSSPPAAFVTGIPEADRMARAGADAVLVTSFDAATQTGRIIRIRPDGALAVAAEGSWYPRSVAYDPSGRIFIATRESTQVLVVPVCPF